MDRIIKFIQVFFLGFASGLPLPFSAGTLSTYLTDNGLRLEAIGAFGLVGMSYTLKFLWAPLVDNISIPFLRKLGMRKSWLLVVQILLVVAFYTAGIINLKNYLLLFIINICAIVFLSATQDIIIDALRIEMIADNDQAKSASLYTFGYRFALIISSAGILSAAHYLSWHLGFTIISGIIALLIINTLSIKEKIVHKAKLVNYQQWIIHSFVEPFQDFMKYKSWLLILVFILVYRLSDAYISMMSNPFYLYLGFDKAEIASIVKLSGLIFTLIGTAVGGYLCNKKTKIYSLLVYSGILAAVTNLFFIILYYAGHNKMALLVINSIDNFASAFANVVFLTYISLLCNNKAFTATQFALLTSFGSFGRTTLSATSGVFIAHFGWVAFFVFSAILAIPGLILIKMLNRKVSS